MLVKHSPCRWRSPGFTHSGLVASPSAVTSAGAAQPSPWPQTVWGPPETAGACSRRAQRLAWAGRAGQSTAAHVGPWQPTLGQWGRGGTAAMGSAGLHSQRGWSSMDSMTLRQGAGFLCFVHGRIRWLDALRVRARAVPSSMLSKGAIARTGAEPTASPSFVVSLIRFQADLPLNSRFRTYSCSKIDALSQQRQRPPLGNTRMS